MSDSRATPRFWALALGVVAAACADQGADDDQKASASGALAPSPLVFPPTLSEGGQNDGNDLGAGPSESPAGGASTGGAASGAAANQIMADPARSSSVHCGDGVHDPDREECDDGPGTEPDVCSQNCQTRDILVIPADGSWSAHRELGSGRHPIAASGADAGVAHASAGALVWIESAPIASVSVSILDVHGNPKVSAIATSGASPTTFANPVIAGLANGNYAVAWNDLNGDGSELGIGLRLVEPGPSDVTLGAVRFANTTSSGAQQDADLVWTGQRLVAAWTDSSDASTGPDVRYQLFDESLKPQGGEVKVASTSASESAVSLAVHEGSFALAYRRGEVTADESIVVVTGTGTIVVKPSTAALWLGPGGAEDRPALVSLGSRFLFLAFTVGTDPENTGVANVFRLYGAVLDTTEGAVSWLGAISPLASSTAGDLTRSQRTPSVVAVGNEIFLSWRSESALGSPSGEDLWLKRLDWGGSALATDLIEAPLERQIAQRMGDQRLPALAVLDLPGSSALALAWEDWGGTFSVDQAAPDIALQVAPLPLRRGPPVEVDCASNPCETGQGPCNGDEQCAADLECLERAGPWFGYGPDTAVCAPVHCNNGVSDGGETGTDCGGSCGTCFLCPSAVPYLGTADFCSAVCRCENQAGDCDFDSECEDGLRCAADTGALVGFPAAIDLCLYDHCQNEARDADEDRTDCGGADCVACPSGTGGSGSGGTGTGGSGGTGGTGTGGGGTGGSGTGGSGTGGSAGSCATGTPNTDGYCTSTCPCVTGAGLCNADNQCLSGQCALGRGLYYGLPVDAGVCSAPHCFDNQRNFDETQVDCGGSCGSECPVCSGDKSFQSFESGLSDWTLPYWGGGPANTELSNDATDGAHSLAYLACGYQELWSTFPASAFEIVGDQLLLDFKFRVADPASLGIGAWLGSITVSLRTPEGQLTTLQPEKAFYRGSENQWLTLSMPVPSALEAALLDDRSGFRFEIALNRACPVGSANDAILLDRLRFSGNAEFRSLCGSDSGGSGGASGTGGGLGTGGSSSGGGTGTGGTSSGGTGGSSTGGTGGSGGTTGNAALIFDFESVSAWLSYQQVPVLSSGEHTSGQHGLDVGTINGTWAEFESTVFSAQDVAETSLLLVDAKLPPAAPYNTIGGTVEVIFECPSAGLWWGSLGTASLAGLPSGEWTALALTVNDQVKAALGTSANDCKLRFRSSIWGQQANSHIYYDNIRFAQPSVCTSYAQITTPPYSVGQPVPGDGTDARPYPLCNAAQLQQLLLTPALWSKSFALQADVDLIGVTGSLGTAVTPFTGRFDGRAHILRNYALTAGDDVGFFGVVQGAVIHDLRLANFTVSGHDNVGAFVGRGSFYAYRITVAGGTVSGTGAQIGGLIGTNEGSIDTSSSSALVSAVGASRVGGAVGYNQGELNNVSAAGAVQLSGATGTAVGGLVGENNAGIYDSYATGTVNAAASNVGGLVGLGSGGTVLHCHANGAVSQTVGTNAGGLLGSLFGAGIYTSFATGTVSGNGAGGLVGSALSSSIDDSFARGAVSGSGNRGGLIGFADSVTVSRAYSTGTVTSGAGSRGAFLGFAPTMPFQLVFTSCLTNIDSNPTLAPVGNTTVGNLSAVTNTALNQQATYVGWDFTAVWILGSAGAELR